jgi:uncharacterized membrane protein YozB (DUF420 family)
MKIILKLLWYFAFLWVAMLCIGVFVMYSGIFKYQSAFLTIKEAAVKTGWYLPAFYCHIIGSSLILFAGFFQFLKAVYNNRPLHKALGKLYVFGVLFFSAPGAYVMTLFVNRGGWVFASFFVQNTLWVVFTLSAWLLIKKGKVTGHVDMMRRSYALAFAAVTLRFYIWVLTVFGHGVDFANNYIIIAFLSWVPNLIVAELINYYDDNTKISPISSNNTD